MTKHLITVGFASVLFASNTFAQTSPPTSLQVSPQVKTIPLSTSKPGSCDPGKDCNEATEDLNEVLRKDLLSVVAREKTKLLQDEIVTINLEIEKIAPLGEEVTIEGVSAQGYSRYVVVDGKRIGQTVLSKLSKGEKSVALNTDNFVSQFEIDPDNTLAELAPEDLIDIDGSEPELIEALKKLMEEEEQEDPSPQTASDGQSGTNSNSNSSGKDGENAQSSATQPVQSATESYSTETRVTTDGCELVIDRPSKVVREQNKILEYENGVLVNESACSDSGRNFPIERSYMTCADVIDLPALEARPQYIEYYNDTDQIRQEISGCTIDEDQLFAIVENRSCPIDIDLVGGVATVYTKLIYQDGNNREIQVRGCEPSQEVQPIKMEQDFSACSIKHDFAHGESTALATWVYELDSAFYQASPCMETDTVYPHKKVYKTDGYDVCPVLIDLSGQIVIPQYRTQITVDGVTQFIDECKPAQDGEIQFIATTETCDNPVLFQHDLGAAVSYGLQRYYYENPDKVFVTECAAGGPTYRHNHEQTGWLHDDEQLVSQPLTTISIDVSGQHYEIASDVLLDGETQIPYAENPVETVAEQGQKTHEGCEVFQLTSLKQDYIRPDDSLYILMLGEGAPLALGDHCTRSNTGWAHNDNELYSQQTTTMKVVYDNVNEVIVDNEVLPNESKVMYVEYSVEHRPTGEKYHEQCEVFERTQAHGSYLRGDMSVYQLMSGAGQPLALGDHCQSELVRWQYEDEQLRSVPYYQDFVSYDQITQNVAAPYARLSEAQNHVLLDRSYEPAGQSFYEGCEEKQNQKSKETYQRFDKSRYTVENDASIASLGNKCIWEFVSQRVETRSRVLTCKEYQKAQGAEGQITMKKGTKELSLTTYVTEDYKNPIGEVFDTREMVANVDTQIHDFDYQGFCD